MADSCTQSFDPILGLVRIGLGPGTLPYQEIKRLYRLCWACCFVWEIPFSISDSICTTLFCLNMCQMAQGPLLYRSPTGRAWAPSIASRRDLLGMGDQCSSQKLFLLCVVSSRDLLRWVYLVTLRPKCSGQKCATCSTWQSQKLMSTMNDMENTAK